MLEFVWKLMKTTIDSAHVLGDLNKAFSNARNGNFSREYFAWTTKKVGLTYSQQYQVRIYIMYWIAELYVTERETKKKKETKKDKKTNQVNKSTHETRDRQTDRDRDNSKTLFYKD